jgi:hypothetical protein
VSSTFCANKPAATFVAGGSAKRLKFPIFGREKASFSRRKRQCTIAVHFLPARMSRTRHKFRRIPSEALPAKAYAI